MKKIIPIILALLLVLSACQSRDSVSPADAPENELVDPVEELVEPEDSVVEESSTHNISDAEEVSQAISIVEHLLDRGEKCDLLFTGELPLLEEDYPQVFGDDEYYPVKSDLRIKEDVDQFWKDTFIMEEHALDSYNLIQDMNMYLNVNGALHVKKLSEEQPPLTTGEWDVSSIRILTFTEDTLSVEMETLLVGQPHGVKTLEIVKEENTWKLTDSYFLD